MLLRTSISKTKRFFQKTIEGFKSIFSSESYQRLPKNPPCPSFPCHSPTTALNYSQNYRHKNDQEIPSRNLVSRREGGAENHDPRAPLYEVKRRGGVRGKQLEYKGKRYEELFIAKDVREERSFWVAKKLKELEMLDKSNAEHVMDLQEILHYYSRLTCPAFVDIVDKFFMDLQSELLTGQPATPGDRHSWPQVKRYGENTPPPPHYISFVRPKLGL